MNHDYILFILINVSICVGLFGTDRLFILKLHAKWIIVGFGSALAQWFMFFGIIISRNRKIIASDCVNCCSEGAPSQGRLVIVDFRWC